MWEPCRHLSAPPRLTHHMNSSPGRPLQLQPSQQLPLTSQQWQQPMSTTATTESARAVVTSRAGPSWTSGGSMVANQPHHMLRTESAGMGNVPNAVQMGRQGHSPACIQPPRRPAWQCTTGIALPVPQVSCQQASSITPKSITPRCEPVVIAPPSPGKVQEQQQQQRQQQPHQSSSRVDSRTTGCNAGLLGIGRRTSRGASTGRRRSRGFSEERKVGASAQIGAKSVSGALGGSGDPIDERWFQVCGEVAKLRQELDKLSTACGDYRSNT